MRGHFPAGTGTVLAAARRAVRDGDTPHSPGPGTPTEQGLRRGQRRQSNDSVITTGSEQSPLHRALN